ncbi:MAG TPA: TetR/AcrR family transcriptional regulator [Thermoanaerobaculia bacterium]|nr:TetR/AcrR family transcriptional regulator [Thermoanaerobaculia bacterium]
MPAPTKTSRDAIVTAAADLLETDGFDGLTMAAVADAVGVRGPSLYKHVPSRAHLVRAIAERTALELRAALERAAASTPDPADQVRAIALAHRAYVRAHPASYALLFAPLETGATPDSELVASVGLPIVAATAPLVGEDRALEGARALAAWAHGFVSMELAGAFRLGGDVEAAYRFGLETLIAGLVSQR